jgi:hypothetical protein
MVNIIYVTHCDDGSCDLGYALYECPKCDVVTEDYDKLWWGQHEPNNTIHDSKCDNCGKTNKLIKVDYGEYEIHKP